MAGGRKAKPSKPYSGYMKFPLSGAQDNREALQNTEFYGDFADPAKRKRILSKRRKYRMEIWLFIEGVNFYDVSELALPKAGVTKETLTEILHAQGQKDLDQWGAKTVLSKSFFKVII